MAVDNYNQKIKEEIKSIEPELLNNFIKYWSLRKSRPFFADSVVKEIKEIEAGTWLSLIESNHKLREKYGEDMAEKLIKYFIIEESQS